jgi:PAS domain S-box-containing protein
MPTRAKAVRIALGYLCLSCLWIFCSGWLLHHFVRDAAAAAFLENVKGWFFVSVTALLLGWVLNRLFREIRAAGEEAQKEAGRVRLLEDNLPDSFIFQYTINRQGLPHFTHVSAGLERVLGLRPADVVRDANVLFDRMDPAQRPAYRAAEAESAAQGADFQMDLRLQGPAGCQRLLRIHARPTREADGLVRWDGLAIDITVQAQQAEARARAEQALRENERLLHTVINLVPHAIFAKDRQSRHLLVNEACAAFNGLTPQQMLGKNDLDFVPDRAQAEAFMRDDREVIDSGRRKVISEERLTNQAGEVRILETVKIPFESPGAGPALLGVAVDLTKLKRSEQNYREIFNATTEAIMIHDAANGAVLEVNDAAMRMYGYQSKDDFLMQGGRNSIATQPPYTWENALQRIQRAVTEGPQVFEWLSQTREGRELWVEVSLRNSQIGGQGRVLAVVRDVTLRKAQELEIQRLTRLYATLSEVNQTIVRCQTQAELFADIGRIMLDLGKFCGVRIGEGTQPGGAFKVLARVTADLEPPLELPTDACGVIAESQQAGRAAICNDCTGDARADSCHEMRVRSGIRSCAAFPLSLQGRPWGVFSVCSGELNFFQAEEVRLLEEIAADISYALERLRSEAERRRAVEALRLSETKFAQAFANNPAAIALTRLADGVVLEVNNTWETMTGYRREEVLGKSARWMWPSPEAAAQFVQALGQHSAVHGYEQEFRNRQGGLYAVQLSAQCLTFNEETVVLSTLLDVTARRRAELALRELNRTLDQRVQERTAELRASIEELDAFAYAVSHDLRAPLRAMNGFSQALIEDFGAQLPPAAHEFLGHIRSGSREMGELIDGLLRLSRSTRGALQRESVDLSALAGRVLAELQQTEPQREVACTVEPGLRAEGDPHLLEVVLNNLLGNAWKYTGRSPHPVIKVHGETGAAATTISVSDNGAGFDMKHAAKLFQPFQRLHREDEFPGLGIGLATVQRIIRRHGGKLEAMAAPGQGATFRFTLPKHDKT